MRDLQTMFAQRTLEDDDIKRLYWWTRGICDGFANTDKPRELPSSLGHLEEYNDGRSFGVELLRMRHS